MERLQSIVPVFVDEVPEELEHGKVYISRIYEVAVHLCACGCGQKTVMPLNQKPLGDYIGWLLAEENGVVSFTPSVGNFQWESPYHAHYYITGNQIVWC